MLLYDGQDGPLTVRINNGLYFSNGLKIEDYHEQDWCEHVYADWSSLDDTGFENLIFNTIEFEKVEGIGFRINGYTIHCYDEQNGYYSSNLSLTINYPNKENVEIDITKCSEYIDY